MGLHDVVADRFEVLARAANGGMATVFRALDLFLPGRGESLQFELEKPVP